MRDPALEPTLPAHAAARARARDRIRQIIDDAIEEVVVAVKREALDQNGTPSSRYQARKVLIEAAAALRRAEIAQVTLQARPRVRVKKPDPPPERIDLPPRGLPT